GGGIAYTIAEIVDRTREAHSLWLVDRDGTNPRRLAEQLGDVAVVSPSPDGSSLAVTADKQIVVVPLDGGAPRTRTPRAQGVGGRPLGNPDGSTIAFPAGPAERRDPSLPYWIDRHTYRFDGLGNLDDVVQDLYVVDVASGDVKQLTDDRAMNAEPS